MDDASPQGTPSQGRKASYGIDAPYVPAALGVVGIAGLIAWAFLLQQVWLLIVGVFFIAQALVCLHTTRRGKFRAWGQLLDQLSLQGSEKVLDLGCGRGAVLLALAHRLPRGEAHGIDLWRSADQSGNDETATRTNARAEGVSDRVELHTGDITDLPFSDSSYDLVASSLAVHNLPTLDARYQALNEALRVLRPGGKLVIADIRTVKKYAGHLRSIGALDVEVRGLGPGFWFAGPWQATSVVTATRSPAGPA